MNIRRYKSEDCKEIIQLFYDTIHMINIKDYTEEQVEAWAPTKGISVSEWDQSFIEHYSIIIEKDKKIIGFGDLDEKGYLDRLFVHKDYQKMGVATAILNKIEKYAQEKKMKTIKTHSSITAKPFFEKQEYKVLKEQSVEKRGQTFRNFIMEKIIILT